MSAKIRVDLTPSQLDVIADALTRYQEELLEPTGDGSRLRVVNNAIEAIGAARFQ